MGEGVGALAQEAVAFRGEFEDAFGGFGWAEGHHGWGRIGSLGVARLEGSGSWCVSAITAATTIFPFFEAVATLIPAAAAIAFLARSFVLARLTGVSLTWARALIVALALVGAGALVVALALVWARALIVALALVWAGALVVALALVGAWALVVALALVGARALVVALALVGAGALVVALALIGAGAARAAVISVATATAIPSIATVTWVARVAARGALFAWGIVRVRWGCGRLIDRCNWWG